MKLRDNFRKFKELNETLNKRLKNLPYKKKLKFGFYCVLKTMSMMWLPFVLFSVIISIFIVIIVGFNFKLPTLAVIYFSVIFPIGLNIFVWYKLLSSGEVMRILERIEKG